MLVFWNLPILLLPGWCLSSGSSKGAEEELKFFSLATQIGGSYSKYFDCLLFCM